MESRVFKDRKEAGLELANSLISFNNKPDTLVLALPRGGVVVGYEIAKSLNLPLDVIVPRKIGTPYNPELAIGALIEDEIHLNEALINELRIDNTYLTEAIKKEKIEAKRRKEIYRQDLPPLILKNKTIILVDDGIATGYTILAAIKYLRSQQVQSLIVAIPVAPPHSIETIEKMADQTICLSTPLNFFAISTFFENFTQTEDQEVIALLNQQNKNLLQ